MAEGFVVLTMGVAILAGGLVATHRQDALQAPALALTAGAVDDLPAAELAATAAQAFETATSRAGHGVTFEVVQRASLHRIPDGPPVEIADPVDPRQTIEVEEAPLATYVERGSITPAGFHAEIRRGPDDPAVPFDWEGQAMEMAALVDGDRTWRNDGAGWYATDQPPGIGLDPVTARLLPTMLRGLTELRDVPDGQPAPDGSGPAVTRTLDGTTTVEAIPGLIAVDLAAATELLGSAKLGFDDAGRLVSLYLLARNTNATQHDLRVGTLITFAYPEERPALPAPEPPYVEPTPAAED